METDHSQRVPPAEGPPGLRDVLQALRPRHWIKNAVVLAAFFFALGDPEQASRLTPLSQALLSVLGVTALFCLVSSGVYVMNDLRDRELDRQHPTKRFRPIASGRLSPAYARLLAALLMAGPVAAVAAMSTRVAGVLAAYVLLQAGYSGGLKHVALLDVLMIAAGFVLRALAGAVALGVHISPWLILCTFLLALFLGFCKRRHELALLTEQSKENRPSLSQYDERLLDQVIAIVSASTVVTYALYTLSPDTVRKFGSAALGFTIPFVLFGIFRYLDLVYRQEKGHRPERVLLTDVPLMIDILLYAVVVLLIALRHHVGA